MSNSWICTPFLWETFKVWKRVPLWLEHNTHHLFWLGAPSPQVSAIISDTRGFQRLSEGPPSHHRQYISRLGGSYTSANNKWRGSIGYDFFLCQHHSKHWPTGFEREASTIFITYFVLDGLIWISSCDVPFCCFPTTRVLSRFRALNFARTLFSRAFRIFPFHNCSRRLFPEFFYDVSHERQSF